MILDEKAQEKLNQKTNMFTLILKVVYHVKSGMVEEFREKLTEASIEATVKTEEGCEAYYYTSHPENDTIVLTERWASKEAQQSHLKNLIWKL